MQLMLWTAHRRESTQNFMRAAADYLLTTESGEEWKEYIDHPDFNLLNDRQYIDEVVEIIQESNDIPQIIAKAAWRDIRKMSCKELKAMMNKMNHGNYYIYQVKEGEQKDLLRLNKNVLVKNLGKE